MMPDKQAKLFVNRQSRDQIPDENPQGTPELGLTKPEREANKKHNERTMHSRGTDTETGFESGRAQASENRQQREE